MTTKNSGTQIISVVVDHIRHTSEGFSVYSGRHDLDYTPLAAETFRYTTVKQFSGPVARGQRWTLAGRPVKDPKWGDQFQASFATLGVPRSPSELEHLLSSGLVDGWTWRSYAALEDTLGASGALEYCVHTPLALDAVPGITAQMIESLADALQRGDGMATIYAQLAEWEVGGKLADKLVRYYGLATVERLQEDPYRDILQIDGYGWKSADSLGNRMGILAQDPRRLQAGFAVAVYEATWATGHTWLTEFEACKAACSLLGTAYEAVEYQLEAALSRQEVVSDGGRLYPAALHRAEQAIADHVQQRLLMPFRTLPVLDRTDPDSHGVAADQWGAVAMALSYGSSVLTGGPGVGKTTSLRTLVQVARDQGLQVTCMAPTGKAAARMTEATGYPATTIHSKLKLIPGDYSLYGDVESLCGLVIVDEVSMLDTTLAAQLFSRLDPSAQLLLVGDPDQLPSVGPGAVLRDLLAANILPRVHLDKVYRNEQGIAVNAARIRHGDTIIAMEDVHLLDANSPAHAAEYLVAVLIDLQRQNISPKDILVLTPTNDGPSGRYALNKLLQPLLNKTTPGEGITQYVGSGTDPENDGTRRSEELRKLDRVMITKNIADLGVFNGQTGTVISVEQPKALTVEVEGRLVRFTGENKRHVTLAYAITGHKSQGSEAKVIIAPIFQSRVLSREWLYTVLTRARESAYLIGDMGAVQGCLEIQRAEERHTGLVQRIHAGVAAVEYAG